MKLLLLCGGRGRGRGGPLGEQHRSARVGDPERRVSERRSSRNRTAVIAGNAVVRLRRPVFLRLRLRLRLRDKKRRLTPVRVRGPSGGARRRTRSSRRRRRTVWARARASSAARSSSGTKPEPRVASSRGGSSSAGLEAVAGPKGARRRRSGVPRVRRRRSPTSAASREPPTAGDGERSGTLAVTLSTSSANASKSYGSTVTSTRSALKFFPSRAEARAVSRDRPPAGSSSASGLILRASAISSSCSSGSASRRLRLVFGGITGVSGRSGRREGAPARRWSPRRTRPRRCSSANRARTVSRGPSASASSADRSSPCASRSAQSTTRATWPGAP